MNIFVLHSKNQHQQQLMFNLEGRFGGVVEWSDDPSHFQEALKRDERPHLILVERKEELFERFAREMRDRPVLPYILVGLGSHSSQVPLGKIGQVGFVEDFDEMVAAIESGQKQGYLPNDPDSNEFCRIDTRLLVKVIPLEADIYIRLSDKKYIKRFRRGHTFAKEDEQKYFYEKKIQYMYVRTDEVKHFVRHFKNSIKQMLDQEVSAESAPEMASAVLYSVADIGNLLGFNGEVMDMAHAGVQLTLKAVGQRPSLWKLYQDLDAKRGTYFSDHAMAVAHTACSLAHQLEWPSETTFRKLSYAAFFHDITIKNHRLSQIGTVAELESMKGAITEEEVKNFSRHPNAAVDLLRGAHEVPPDVDKIIAQHHERPDGSGFPRGLVSHQIAPLSALFIVAHDVVKFVYEGRAREGYDAFAERFGYPEEELGPFEKVLAVLDFPPPLES